MAINNKHITVDMLSYFKTKQDASNISKFVAIESGKSLSANDFTDALKTKLDGVAAGAQVNVIESISLNNEALAISNKAVNIDLSEYAKLTDLTTVYKYKGSVDTYAQLPVDPAPAIGDVYNIVAADAENNIKAGDNVVWTGTAWDNLSGTVDLSAYVTSTNLNTTLASYVTQAHLDEMLAGYTDSSDPDNIVIHPGYVTTSALTTALGDYTTTTNLAANYVAKDGAKVLSTNDFTNDLKNKLEDMADATTADIDALFEEESTNNEQSGNTEPDPQQP